MMNLKNKLKISFFIFLSACSPLSCRSGEIIVFDDPGFVMFRLGNIFQGYYSADEGRYSCDFFIMGNFVAGLKSDKNKIMKIKTFSLMVGNGESRYNQRDPWFDIDGNIFLNDDIWTVQTDTEVPACDQVVSGFAKEGARKDFIKGNTFPAIGIRIISKKTYLYHKNETGYARQRGYLVQDDVVALLEVEGKFSKIRYVNPNLESKSGGKITVDWIRSDDLVDPFPPSPDRRSRTGVNNGMSR